MAITRASNGGPRNARGLSLERCVLVAMVSFFGCDDERKKDATEPEEEASPTCEVSAELLDARRVCVADDECPCGAHCEFGLCAASCRSDADCAESQRCDRFGECRSTLDKALTGTTRPTKSATDGLKFTTTRAKLKDETQATTVHVVSNEKGPVRVVGTKKLSVRCNPSDEFASECMTQAGREGARVEVRRRAAEKAAGEMREGPEVLKVFPKHGGARLLSVDLEDTEPLPPFGPFQQGGQYAGTATFSGAGGAEGEMSLGTGLGLWVSLDLYPGAAEQVLRLRDPSGTLSPSGELVGTVLHAPDGSQKFSFPSYLYLDRGTGGPDAVEVVASPRVTGTLTDTGLTLSVQLTLSGITSQDAPSQRWELQLTRVAERPSENTPPAVPPSRGLQLAASRADTMFALESQWTDAPHPEVDETADVAAIRALCGDTVRTLDSSARAPLSGDLGCDGNADKYFTLPYLVDQSRTRDALLTRCVADLAEAAAARAPHAGDEHDPLCVDMGQALWAAAASARLPGSPAQTTRMPLRVLSQLVGLSQFVALQSREQLRFHARAQAALSTTAPPHDALMQDAQQKLEAAWTPFWWFLTPRLGKVLFGTSGEYLTNPSYEAVPSEALATPLPVLVGEALAEQVSLMADIAEAAHFGGKGAPPQNALALRRILTARTLAHALWTKAKVYADGQPELSEQFRAMDARFEGASRAIDAAWERLVRRVRAIQEGKNPLAIEDADIPLYRADAEATTPRMQAFASSTYLTSLAESAIQDASTAWAAAEAEDQAQRGLSLQLQIANHQSVQRVMELERSQRERIESLCGMPASAAGAVITGSATLNVDTCFLAQDASGVPVAGCDFTPPTPTGPPEVFFQACQFMYLRADKSSQYVRPPEATRAQEIHTFFDEAVKANGKDAASSIEVAQAGQDFVLKIPGSGAMLSISLDDLGALDARVPDPGPIPVSTSGASIEHFSASDINQLNPMRAFGEAKQICAAARDDRYGSDAGSRQIPAALDRAECYRGTIGEAALASRRARTGVLSAQAKLDQHMQAYEIAVQQCRFDDAAGNLQAESQAKFEEDTAGLKDAIFAMGIVSQVMDGVVSVAESVAKGPVGIVEGVVKGVGAAANIAGTAMQRAVDDQRALHEARVAEIGADSAKRKCMNNAQLSLVGLDNARLQLVMVMQALEGSLLRLNNLKREASNAVQAAALSRAREGHLGLSRVVGTPWLSRAHEDVARRMRLAQRVTYLVVRAAEWESQQTLGPSRVAVLSALTPAHLKRELDALIASFATRSIPNTSTVGQQYAVVSVKEQLMRKLSATSADAFEQRLSAEDALRREWMNPKYAVYDGTRYLGQQIPLELAAPGVAGSDESTRIDAFSGNDCAERLWTVLVGIDGEAGVSGDSTLTTLEVFKHNTFYSQGCGGGDVQSATVAPGRNLFLDPEYQGSFAEIFDKPSADTYTRATLSAVRTNVTRTEFEMQAYNQGAQTGFAGRGLFGQYALFFPAESLRHEECTDAVCVTRNEAGLDLSRINDVLLRFEYVAWSAN